jgi:hypothetical protein
MGVFHVLIPMARRALVFLPILFAGCASLYDEITLNADGSGTYQLTIYVKMTEATENLEQLRLAVRDKATKIAQDAGFTLTSIDLTRDGPLLRIEVKAGFRSLSAFAHPALAVASDWSQWSFVVPRQMTFKDGRFTARVLRDSAPPKDHSIRASFPGREARFTVHFPGEVVESNGDRNERLANWNFPLARLCDEPIEMVARYRSDFPWAAVALGAFLMAALAVLLVQAFRKRRPA